MAEKPIRVEYVWIDGQKPTAKMRGKTKVVYGVPDVISEPTGEIPKWINSWGFDGSSTNQANTKDSDLALKPVFVIPDPLRGSPHVIVLCEVNYLDGRPHESNTRAVLRETFEKYKHEEPWFGFEQEYTLYDKDGLRPLRWPEGGGYPAPQGKYYCGVGADEVLGSRLIEVNTDDQINASLKIAGTNAEVMPSQWEFQNMPSEPPFVADGLWLARWILYRRGEQMGYTVKLDPKPILGDWNGAGCHSNFSIKRMRGDWGINIINAACIRLSDFHREHMWAYGADNYLRLTGVHETCPIEQFKFAVGHRGCSIRIPAQVAIDGMGYLEDRRPAANMDPYQVSTALLETVCGRGFDPDVFSYFYTREHKIVMRGLEWKDGDGVPYV
jgi:glutamine synthetase